MDQPDAMMSLATMYIRGVGVKKDAKQAAHWLRKAAALGHPEAKAFIQKAKDSQENK